MRLVPSPQIGRAVRRTQASPPDLEAEAWDCNSLPPPSFFSLFTTRSPQVPLMGIYWSSNRPNKIQTLERPFLSPTDGVFRG